MISKASIDKDLIMRGKKKLMLSYFLGSRDAKVSWLIISWWSAPGAAAPALRPWWSEVIWWRWWWWCSRNCVAAGSCCCSCWWSRGSRWRGGIWNLWKLDWSVFMSDRSWPWLLLDGFDMPAAISVTYCCCCIWCACCCCCCCILMFSSLIDDLFAYIIVLPWPALVDDPDMMEMLGKCAGDMIISCVGWWAASCSCITPAAPVVCWIRSCCCRCWWWCCWTRAAAAAAACLFAACTIASSACKLDTYSQTWSQRKNGGWF